MNILLSLYYEFFKIGLFAVGGGLATIPFLQELSEKTSWFTISQLADMIAISESTPGPLGVNVATYVGFETAGILGSIVSTLGLVTPSIIIILIIARVLEKFRNNKYVDSAFYGLRAASTALIASAGISVAIIALYTGEGVPFSFKYISLYQHSGPEKRWLKSKMSKNRIETYLCDGKARK